MRRLLLLLILAIFSACTVATATVFCQTSTPHIVIGKDVWLLAEDTGSRLFLLPETYYAKIDALDETYYIVTFNGARGKVPKTAVSTVGYHSEAKGTMQELSISGDYSEFKSISLKKLPSLSADEAADIPIGKTFTFIGTYPTPEGVWYYVRFGETQGYIRSDRTTIKDMVFEDFVPESPPSEDASASPTDDSGTDTEPEEEDSHDKVLRIIIIVGLAIPAVLIVVLLFKPARNAKKYEEDD